MRDTGLLILRLTTGGMLAGHGAQKLFGAFEGPGLRGTAGMMESLGLKPGRFWGTAAALSEFGGGTLTALGLLYPLGPLGIIASMSMATAKVHWGKPIWASAGGAELPVLNMGAALALAMAGPGRYSLDHLLGIRVPRPVVALAGFATGAALVYGILQGVEEATSDGSAPAQDATVGARGSAPAQDSTKGKDATVDARGSAEDSTKGEGKDEDEEVQGGYGGMTYHENPDVPPGKSIDSAASSAGAEVQS
jgi:putative oxidoreductase